jgi:formylglycine-generating enzyme required for sulfatase activity
MSEKNIQVLKTVQIQSNQEVRLLPFIIAGLICFSIAVLLGSGGWYFLGSNKRKIVESEDISQAVSNENQSKTANPLESKPAPNKSSKAEIKGLVAVSGDEITLGGGDTKQPLERVLVNDFSIAETEVTNLQYAEFIKETNYRPPPYWKKGVFPKGTDNLPVTNVSYKDAEAFCQWLEKRYGLPVRLPTEAEWELAAGAKENKKYPWGDNWDDKNAASKETGGKISAVKSYPQNRSTFGAYDMVGNVWEWTQEKVGKGDVVTDEAVQQALDEGKNLRIVKGGSAMVSYKELSIQARYEIPENIKVPVVGFRYVVEHKPND